MWWNKSKQNVFIGDTKKLDRGFLKACDAVVKTLGAEGKLALLDNLRVNEPPSVTKDGVTVIVTDTPDVTHLGVNGDRYSVAVSINYKVYI